MKKLLVTGAAGFIGSNFVHYWHNNYPEDFIVVLDALTYAGNRDNIADLEGEANFKFVHGDICDTALVEKLLTENDIDTLVHFAAESHVDRSITGPDAFINTNILGTYSLLKACKKIWLDGDKVKEDHRFFAETNQYLPNSPYSASKASSDLLVRSFHHTYGLNVTTSNCSNNYGYYHHPEKLIPLTLTNILRGKNIPVYGDGKQIRDWLFVTDHCYGIDLVLKKGRLGESYNIGGINEWANIDIVNLLCEQVDQLFANNSDYSSQYPDCPCSNGKSAKTLITHVTDRLGHDRRYAIDARKIMTELGYKPKDSFETGIAKTIRWYLDHQEWWKKLIK